MKHIKLIPVLLTVIMLLSLCACGENSDIVPDASQSIDPISAPAEELEQNDYLTLEEITGYWKYDAYSTYYFFDSDGLWEATNMDSGDRTSGELLLEADVLTLSDLSGDVMMIQVVSIDQLVDEDGDCLSRYNPSDDNNGYIEGKDAVSISPLLGSWAFGIEDYYYTFYEDGTWESFISEEYMLDSGTYEFDGSTATLVSEKTGTYVLTFADENHMVDEAGDTCARYDPAA